MKVINTYTILELLLTPTIRGNQTVLAKLLKINRSTLRKYLDDTTNANHVVLVNDNKYVFMHSTAPHTNRRIQ